MPLGLRGFDVATTAAIGALTLIDPAPLRPGARALYRGMVAVLAGAVTWDALSPRPPARRRRAPVATDDGDDDGDFAPYGEYGAYAPAEAAPRRTGGRDLEMRVAYTAGAVGVAVGLADISEALDGLLHRRLERTGLRHPRRVMAAGAVALSLAAAIGDRRTT